MKTNTMKLIRLILLSIVALTPAVVTVSQVNTAHALPTNYVAAAGTGAPCSLPDGGTGVIMSDGRTCCPQGSKDGTACLYNKYINPAINLLSAAVGLIVVAAIIYGGIQYITSAGDPQKAAEGQKRIIEALIGLVAFILLYAVLVFLIPGGFL